MRRLTCPCSVTFNNVRAYNNLWESIGDQVARALGDLGKYHLKTVSDFDQTMTALAKDGHKVVLFFDEADELLRLPDKDGFLGELRTLKGTVVQVHTSQRP